MCDVTVGHELARDAFARGAWSDAYTLFTNVEVAAPDDLERLAIAAYLLGRDAESADAWERAHLEFLRVGDRERAVRCAFWLGIQLLLRGEMARGGGWIARAERVAATLEPDCAERGLLLVPAFLEKLQSGDVTSADAVASEALRLATQHDDKDLLALALLSRGQVALAFGQIGECMKLLDEAMVSVTTGEVSPIPSGIVYCAVIEACMDVSELGRATEWTNALHRWCSSDPSVVPYRGQCLVHRSQILLAHGSWADAALETQRACSHLSQTQHPALGLALYQEAELHRLRGDFTGAASAYHAAASQGRDPVPGLALLRLAEGNVDAAVAAIRQLGAAGGQLPNTAVLAASVEVFLAAGDVETARRALDALGNLSAALPAALPDAITAYAKGKVLLAEDDPEGALIELRRARMRWHELEMPYDEAQARVQIAVASRALGDAESVELELDAAFAAFERLGALPDLARVAAIRGGPQSHQQDMVLTDRECEVLRLVATGKTNREIASHLIISEHTVGRHLQNIFTKLGVSSRAAATAYAFQHELI